MQFAVCNSRLNSQLHSRMQFAIQNILQVCLYTKGAKTFGVRLSGQTTTHVKIYSLVWEIRPPPLSSSMKRKVIGLGNIEGPYPGTWNFLCGSKGTIYAPCKNIVMLSCLVWKIRSTPLSFHVYGLRWNEKSSGSETSKAPTQRPEFFRVESLGQSTPSVNI